MKMFPVLTLEIQAACKDLFLFETNRENEHQYFHF